MPREAFGVIRRKGTHRRLVPEFIFNTTQTRTVLAFRAWRWLHKRKAAPPDLLDRWKDLDAEATATLKLQRGKVMFAGTYITGQYAVAYSAWRMGEPNRELAEKYNVSEEVIEVTLRGLIDAAKVLGYETGSKTPRRKYQRKKGVRTAEEYHRSRIGQPNVSATRSQTMILMWATKRAHELNLSIARQSQSRYHALTHEHHESREIRGASASSDHHPAEPTHAPR
jgi:hypothetical protein